MREHVVFIKDSGETINLTEKFGIRIMSGTDTRIAPDLKSYETIDYIEEPGERIYPVVYECPYDYTIKLSCKADGVKTNDYVIELMEFMSPKDSDGKRVSKKVGIYDGWNKTMIYGYLKEIKGTDMYYSKDEDISLLFFDLKLRVSNPDECDYAAKRPEEVNRNLLLQTRNPVPGQGFWNRINGAAASGDVGGFTSVNINANYGRMWTDTITYKAKEKYSLSFYGGEYYTDEATRPPTRIAMYVPRNSGMIIRSATVDGENVDVGTGEGTASSSYVQLSVPGFINRKHEVVLENTTDIDISLYTCRPEYIISSGFSSRGVLYGYKLEQGSKSTKWSPNPSDLDYGLPAPIEVDQVGLNHLWNTSDFQNTTYWTTYGSSVSVESDADMGSVVKITSTASYAGWIRQIDRLRNPEVAYYNGQDWILSFMFKGTAGIGFSVRSTGSESSVISTEYSLTNHSSDSWTKVEIPVTITNASDATSSHAPTLSFSSGSDFAVTDIKFEHGHKATAYSIAPNDPRA